MFERLEKMDRRTVIALVVAGIVGILAFGAIAGTIRQAGWNEGFLFGLLAGDGDTQALTPYLTHGRGFGWHHGGFGFFGFFFRILFFVFVLSLIAKFFGFWRWRAHMTHGGGPHWHQHGPYGQGPWQQPQPQQGGDAPGGSSQPEENKPQNTSWTNV
jgi:hypothetical protein